jgi:hypothetical protein
MSLPAPNLDGRRFEDLVREARARIPRYTPEWTNFNDSDPGMTLVKLHAWLAETILYELNRVPELNYVKFLDLLGITARPAQPARTELSFELDKLDAADDPLTVNVPRLTKVAVDDPDLPTEVVFETDRTLIGMNAAIGALIVPWTGGTAQTRQLVSRYENDRVGWPHSFDALPGAAQAPVALYLGLVLRPIRKGDDADYAEDRFPVGPLDVCADAVRILDTSPPLGDGTPGATVTGPIGLACPQPGSAGTVADHVEWQVYVGEGSDDTPFDDDLDDAGWARLALSEDGTLGLAGSGHLVFEMPATARPLDPARLSAAFWESFGAVRPPRSKSELEDQLRAGTPEIVEGLADLWETMGATPDQVDELAACGQDAVAVAGKIADDAYDLDPTALSLAEWLGVNEGYGAALPATDQGYRPLYWIRGRIRSLPTDAAPPVAMRGLHLNTVPATQASTRLDDRLGRSDARPAQVFTLPKVPVLIDPQSGEPDLQLHVTEGGQPPLWSRVDDFHSSGPEDPHYLLEPDTGRITLGDGRHGRIPVAGSQVNAVRYRVGGGSIGNVGAGLVTKLKGRLRGVAGASNLRAAHDGGDAEPLEEVKLRAPHDLRTRDRAVSAEDFADLALLTPGVTLHRAFTLPRYAVAADQSLETKDGAVTLLVLPISDQLTPQPDEDEKRAICRWLEPRRLITTELHITGPRYAMITRLSARLSVRREFDLGAVRTAVYDSLLTFLSPFVGGEDGKGWPFGQNLFYGDLYERILAVPGVRRAWQLSVEIDGTPGDSSSDLATISEGRLPALSRDRIDLVAAYE